MNDIAKQSASDKLQSAIAREGVTTQEAGTLIGIKPIYISMFKNKKHWSSVGTPQWDKLLAWVNSGYSIREYLKHHPELELPADHVDMKKIKISTAREIDPEAFPSPLKEKSAIGTPFDEAIAPPEHIASGEPMNEEEMAHTEGLIPYLMRKGSDKQKTVKDFIEENSCCVIMDDLDTRYHYMPFWFKMNRNTETFEIIPFSKLPAELKEAIKTMRGE